MRVMVLIKANADSEQGVMPTADYMAKMMQYNEMLVNKGVMLAGDGLLPSNKGKRVRFEAGKKPIVIDGPFAETKELLAGFWMWRVSSMEEAIALVKQIPEPDLDATPASRTSEIEIRQVGEMEDFGDLVTPEVMAQAERLDAEIKRRQ